MEVLGSFADIEPIIATGRLSFKQFNPEIEVGFNTTWQASTLANLSIENISDGDSKRGEEGSR